MKGFVLDAAIVGTYKASRAVLGPDSSRTILARPWFSDRRLKPVLGGTALASDSQRRRRGREDGPARCMLLVIAVR
jgi:hypothetical protein